MGQYTEDLKNMQYEISLEDEDYTEKLLSVAKSFRTFGEALDEFLVKKGFMGNVTDVEEKVTFLKKKFHAAGISSMPRNLRKWFTEGTRLEKREIAFQFCVAFGLDLKESQEFFGRVCLQEGLDCHCIEEAIYYYVILNGLSYSKAEELKKKVPEDKKGKIDFKGEVLFTSSIIQEMNRWESEDELLKFFQENIEQFTYNSATAYKYITEIWQKIKATNGLAEKERMLLFPEKEKEQEKSKIKNSNWKIYLQMLGFYDFDEDAQLFTINNKERTLKPILKNNELLHPLAEESFPDRKGLEGILRGEHKSKELVRKMLILLVFYKYWTSLLIKKGKKNFIVDPKDSQRCLAEINRYLLDSGYLALYVGNPYDWIFLFVMGDESPLEAFRYFMRELYAIKEDEKVSLQ